MVGSGDTKQSIEEPPTGQYLLIESQCRRNREQIGKISREILELAWTDAVGLDHPLLGSFKPLLTKIMAMITFETSLSGTLSDKT